MAKKQTPDPAVLNEALIPDLSTDKFTVLGKEITIKPLKMRYQIEFAQVLEPYGTDAAYEAQTTGHILTALSVALKHTAIIPKLIALMAKNDGVELTEDELLDSDLQMDELIPHIVALAAKNEKIGRPVLDFFQELLPGGLQSLEPLMVAAKTKAKTAIRFMSTALSSDSVTNTDGPSTIA